MFFYFMLLLKMENSFKLYQTLNCINLIFHGGYDTPRKVYRFNLKDFFDTENNTNSSCKVEFF